MSSTRRAPKRDRLARRADADTLRTARRDSLLVLLSRAQRGVLSSAEAVLLRAHVEAEVVEGDTARTGERGQQRAMERHRQRAEQVEQLLAAAHQCSNDAEQQRSAWQARAEGAEAHRHRLSQQLDDVKRRRDDARAGRRDAERALDRVRQANTLGEALAAVAQFDGLTPQAAAIQAALTDRADTVEARLAEQAREHAVALAEVEHRARTVEKALAEQIRERHVERQEQTREHVERIGHERRAVQVAEERARELEAERDRLARDVTAMHDGINQTAREAFAERRQHRQALAEQRTRAEQAEAALDRVRDLARRMRAGSPKGAAAIYADRIEQALADPDEPIPYALTTP